MTEVFQKYFSPENLMLAWERVTRSGRKDTKDYFGIEIYSSNLGRNISRLSDIVIGGQFKPHRPFKYYEPKASKTHRTKSVLSIDDALVYQAIANVVATNSYKKLSQNNSFVFGSVLHPEVEQGTALLNSPDAEFYFFEYYLPLYNKFINSVNLEIGNTNVRYKLETDITGFFDSIPHSKLLMALHEFGVEPEILDLLQDCLNIYSGTRDSVTPGIGIPQGIDASFFFANLFLCELDYQISQKGYTYYRYMDDIRIYDETEEKIIEVLVFIDSYLKGKALSLNTKKTSIEEIGDDREAEKLLQLAGYGDSDLDENGDKSQLLSLVGQDGGFDIQIDDRYCPVIAGEELVKACRKEIADVESILKAKFQNPDTQPFDRRALAGDESFKKEIVHIAYRWRNANSILKTVDAPVLNPEMIPIWLACIEIFFWKANHFCWNLNQYGNNRVIRDRLLELIPRFTDFEWVRYQILSNMAFAQEFNSSELRDFFRKAKEETSPLVRLGYYMALLKHVDSRHQLFSSLRQAIKDDREPYVRTRLFPVLSGFDTDKKIDELKFWFGL
ncbi:MAG: RNA-directed DNA polymerase [Prevotellaceae bacterium]|nr:RNA-directed DNA polymerase [Prevotellaceae bacterium]